MKNLLFISGMFALFFLMVPRSVSAASLQFDPTSVSCTVSGTCSVDIVVDAGSDEILATDAKIAYDSSVVSVSGIADGTYLTIGKKDSSKSGEIYIAGIVDDPAQSKTGSGTLATVTFTGVKNGKTTLSITCQPGETAADSNIAKNDLNATDIIQCSDNGTSVITVGTGNGSSSDTTTTTTTTSTTPTTLPRSGVFDELVKFAIPGGLLLLLGVGLKLIARI